MNIGELFKSGIAGAIVGIAGLAINSIVRRKIRVLVHQAFFVGNPEPYYFMNVTNLSRNREIEIVSVWLETMPQTYVKNPQRPLPKRLKTDESWETWIAASEVRVAPEIVYKLARVRLSNGAVFKSKQNKKVSTQGAVPGDLPPSAAASGILHIPSEAVEASRLIGLLRRQLSEPIEQLRHDDPKVERWETVTHRILVEAFGDHTRQVNHFVFTVTQSGLSDEERQIEYLEWVRSKKGLIEGYIDELELFPPKI